MAFFRRKELVDLPANPERHSVPGLSVHTAESMVVLTIPVAGAGALIDAASSRRPAALEDGDLVVNLVPVRDAQLVPAHDPKRGWIIPLTSEVAADVAAQVAGGVGAYEIAGLNLGVIVE
ncbi:MAG: hypothetical protein Q4G50_12815 [Corynebacterium sp.]|uniref:hypothetical protein n=1 Tax=Corynebacterium sp. TaxID=1720 RepID=UPI0026E07FBA|nr:hypothetical protein [Corynebacterium sp.]MDO5670867.1 hypothetical protein [Corynebacterium sp.]